MANQNANPINCVLCKHMKIRAGTDSYALFVCGKANNQTLDETPKPKWCPLDQPSVESEENHNYQTSCERGKLDV